MKEDVFLDSGIKVLQLPYFVNYNLKQIFITQKKIQILKLILTVEVRELIPSTQV